MNRSPPRVCPGLGLGTARSWRLRPGKNCGLPVKKVCTVHCGSFTMPCMVASSIPCKLSLCADRAHACAGDSHASSGIDVACPTTQSVLAIASPHELHGDSWPSSSTGTSSFCCNHQYSVTAITTSTGAIAERYAYTAYGQPTILNASGLPLTPQSSTLSNRYSYTGREWDATLGLHHFRARWMSPIAGRFLGRDPIGYEAGVSVYQFLRSRILVRLDPTGTVDINCHCSCIQQGHGGRVDDSFETDVTVNCLTLPTICCSRACEIERRNRYGDPPIRGCDTSSCTFTWQWGPPLPPVKPEHCSIPDCIGGCSLAAASAIFLCQRAGLPGFICQNAGRSAAVACAMRCFWRCDDPCSWIAPNLIPCVPINPNTPR